MSQKILCLILSICLLPLPAVEAGLPQVHASQSFLNLPEPGRMVNLSPAYQPAIIKGITVHKDNPFLFDFLVDVGQDKLQGEALKAEGDKLIKYFMATLTIPEKDLWVNLSPYEKDRTVPEALGQTDMGRDLLAQDYILKQITASLIYPETGLGKKFWDRVYAKINEEVRLPAGQSRQILLNVPINTFNKVWIMADKAEVFERNQTAFVTESHLKVLLETDYLALQKAEVSKSIRRSSERKYRNEAGLPQKDNDTNAIIKDIILPELEREVNTGKNFATLRQIFNSIILASWYKNNLKNSILNEAYSNKSKVKGINIDAKINKQIYERYLQAYKKGVFNYIKDADQPRKYFSGGVAPAKAFTPVVTSIMPVNVAKDVRERASDFAQLTVKINNQAKGSYEEELDEIERHLQLDHMTIEYLKKLRAQLKEIEKMTEGFTGGGLSDVSKIADVQGKVKRLLEQSYHYVYVNLYHQKINLKEYEEVIITLKDILFGEASKGKRIEIIKALVGMVQRINSTIFIGGEAKVIELTEEERPFQAQLRELGIGNSEESHKAKRVAAIVATWLNENFREQKVLEYLKEELSHRKYGYFETVFVRTTDQDGEPLEQEELLQLLIKSLAIDFNMLFTQRRDKGQLWLGLLPTETLRDPLAPTSLLMEEKLAMINKYLTVLRETLSDAAMRVTKRVQFLEFRDEVDGIRIMEPKEVVLMVIKDMIEHGIWKQYHEGTMVGDLEVGVPKIYFEDRLGKSYPGQIHFPTSKIIRAIFQELELEVTFETQSTLKDNIPTDLSAEIKNYYLTELGKYLRSLKPERHISLPSVNALVRKVAWSEADKVEAQGIQSQLAQYGKNVSSPFLMRGNNYIVYTPKKRGAFTHILREVNKRFKKPDDAFQLRRFPVTFEKIVEGIVWNGQVIHLSELRNAIDEIVGEMNRANASNDHLGDPAMLKNTGGIDLKDSAKNTNVRKEGNGVEFKVDSAMVERVRREGIQSLTPIIVRITPAVNILTRLGLEP